jgi:hypothetical protein
MDYCLSAWCTANCLGTVSWLLFVGFSMININISIHVCASFQVDANAIYVDYSNVTTYKLYPQSVSDMRVAARYATK